MKRNYPQRSHTHRKNSTVTKQRGYIEARRVNSAALVLEALPCLRDIRLKIAMLPPLAVNPDVIEQREQVDKIEERRREVDDTTF